MKTRYAVLLAVAITTAVMSGLAYVVIQDAYVAGYQLGAEAMYDFLTAPSEGI